MPDPGSQTHQSQIASAVDPDLAERLGRSALIAWYYDQAGDPRKSTATCVRLHDEIEHHRRRTGQTLQVSVGDAELPTAQEVATWEEEDQVADWEYRLAAKRARRAAAHAEHLVRQARAEAALNDGKIPQVSRRAQEEPR